MDGKNITNLTLGFNFPLIISYAYANSPTSSISRSIFQTLTVKSLVTSTPTIFLLYVNPNATSSGSNINSTTTLEDKVIREAKDGSASNAHYLTITGDIDELTRKDLSSKNIALVTVKNAASTGTSTNSGVVTLEAKDDAVGFNTVGFTMTTK